MSLPVWAVHCLDAPGSAALRKELRPHHSRWLRDGRPRPLLYGPLTADATGEVVGSLIVVAAPDRETVERHFAEDPFRTGGVWQQIRVDRFDVSPRSPVRLPEPA